jgi:hypothetical protein
LLRASLLSAALVLLAVPATAPAATRSCPGFASSSAGGQVSRLRATGIACHAARTVVKAWREVEDCYSGQAEECTALRYACAETGDGYTTTVTCRRGARRVTWRQGVS